MKNFAIIFFILSTLSDASVAFCVQDSVKTFAKKIDADTENVLPDSVVLNFRMQALRPVLAVRPFLLDKFGLALKQTFKYDTTWDNPENRCYEYKKPITPKYLFLFKFTSQQQYQPSTLP